MRCGCSSMNSNAMLKGKTTYRCNFVIKKKESIIEYGIVSLNKGIHRFHTCAHLIIPFGRLLFPFPQDTYEKAPRKYLKWTTNLVPKNLRLFQVLIPSQFNSKKNHFFEKTSKDNQHPLLKISCKQLWLLSL